MISISTSKSGSNWLDRLRSSRGFPTGDEPDLDRFLTSSSSCTSNSTTRSDSTHLTRRRVNSDLRNFDNNVVGNFSEVLSDLFNMGESSRTFSKKNCRKQSNPRFFNSPNLELKNPILVNSPNLEDKTNEANPRLFNSPNLEKENNDLCSSDDLRREKSENLIVSSGDNSLNDKNCNDKVNDEVRNDNGEEKEVIDMKEYTRSEVTVIDTSFEEWKSDKWVFRKKDDWKIKDKKKSKLNYKNKRKLLGDDVSELKKRVVEIGEIDEDLLKEKKIMHLNKPKNDKATELLKEAAEFVGKVSQSRFPCPRPPEKFRTESSPVVLLKPIPSSNNANGVIRLGKSAKKGRPKKFKII